MPERIKAIDCCMFRPRVRPERSQASSAIEAETAEGRGGILSLFPGAAERLAQPGTDEDLVTAMDAAGVEKGLVVVYDDEDREWVVEAQRKYPGRFLLRVRVNPLQNGVMNEVRRVRRLIEKCGLQIITVTGYYLGVPCTDSRLFPLYSLAIDYDLKVGISVGYPGPAGLARNQHPLQVDELCYLFPELKVIQTHLGHPWIEEVVHNVIKYPNCYVMTNEYREKYFPPEFVHHMNTRAQDKVMWASGHPIVTFEQSLADIETLPLRDHVRPKYLRGNALRLFKFE